MVRVAILANLVTNAPSIEDNEPEDIWDDLDSPQTIQDITKVLQDNGHIAKFFEANISCIPLLQEFKPDICFNIAEGLRGQSRESHIPAILEMLGIPYTGSSLMTLAIALDKPMTKRVLSFNGIVNAPFQVFKTVDEALELDYPLFIKPSSEGTSIAISSDNIIHDEQHFRRKVEELLVKYKQPVLVEKYIEGREFTVGILGNGDDIIVLPPIEVLTNNGVYDSELKHNSNIYEYLKCPINDSILDERLKDITKKVFNALECRDISRVDFRLETSTNKLYVLEINPLPGLNKRISDIIIPIEVYGMTYDQLIMYILNTAMKRYNL